MNRWSTTWPTDQGLYLFYGRRKHSAMPFHWQLVSVVPALKGAQSTRLYQTDTGLIDDLHWEGVWRPFDEKPPDVSAFGV